MMLAHPQMDTVFNFDASRINTLVIENPSFFREFLQDISFQISGSPGKTVLSHKDAPISFPANAEILDSFLSFDINRKSLITKLAARMEAIALNESNYARTSQILAEFEAYFQELYFDLPCDIFCSKMQIGGFLRAAGLSIPNEYENDLERLLDYMELARELDRDRLFIFVNLRSYYSTESLSAFLSSVLSHELHILLVDNTAQDILALEQRVTIDQDLCEF